MPRQSVVVVGGGISGLCAAYELSGGVNGPIPDTPRIEVLDAGHRFGGGLATTEFAGRTMDLGADGFLARRPEGPQLAADLGLAGELEAIDASGAWIYLNGQLNELPKGLVLGVPTSSAAVASLPGLPRGARYAAWRDEHFPRSYVAGEDATIGEILRAKLGPTLTYQLIEPMIGGIQAGRVDELSAKAVFPALLKAAQRKGSLMKNLRSAGPAMPGPQAAAVEGPAFQTLRRGVGSFITALTSVLSERGVVIRTDAPVTMLRRTPSDEYPWAVDTASTTTPASVVIVATSASIASGLLGAYDPDLKALSSIPNVGAAMVSLQFRRGDITLPATGTGVLIPLSTPFDDDVHLVTALTFLDRKWPHLRRDEDILLRVHVGRSDDHRWTAFSDEQLRDRVLAEVAVVVGPLGTPLSSLVQRWPEGLPQYYVGHDDVVARANEAACRVGVVLVGNAYNGVGVPASIGSGRGGGREALARLTSH